MPASFMQIDQVEQGEQVNPDDIDEVPVQPADLHRRVVFRSEAPPPCRVQKPGENADADDHVQRVQSGHDEVKREINLRVLRVGHLIRMARNRLLELETGSGNVMQLKLFLVFIGLDAQESESQD